MKTNIFKRIVTSVFIAVIIISGMPVTAFSEDSPTINESSLVSLTLTKYKALDSDSTNLDDTVIGKKQTVAGRETMKDVDFTVLKFATLVQENDGNQVKLQYSLTEKGAEVLSKGGTQYTANQKVSNDILKAFITPKTAGDSVFVGLETMSTAVTATTGADGVVKFTSNSSVSETAAIKHINGQGLYLVVETAAPENVTNRTHPFFVSLPMSDGETFDKWQYDVYAYPKNSTGSINFDKEIYEINGSADVNHSAEANIGDVITYRIPFTMAIPGEGLTKLEITDTMSEGLTLKTASTNVASTDITINRLADNGSRTPVSSDNYTAKTTKNADGTTTLTVDLSAYINTLNNNAANQLLQLEVIYKAVLNENAVTGDKGNGNNAKLIYRNTGVETDKETAEAKTKVYTWGINLLKVGEKDEGLAGVEFKLATGSGTTLKFDKIDEGVYVPSEKGDEKLVTASNGKITINGLKSGGYKLTEVKAKSGYVLLKNPVEIVITGDSKTGEATATVNGKGATMSSVTAGGSTSSTALVEVKIVNSKGFLLPSTGGAGTAMFTIAGIAIIVISVTLLLLLRRRNEKQ